MGDTNSQERCMNALEISRKNFKNWRGLPPQCNLKNIASQYPLYEPRQGRLGLDENTVSARCIEMDAYDEEYLPMVWYNDKGILKIDIEHPDIPDKPDALMSELGMPDAALDYYYGVNFLIDKGELVFTKRGITLFLNTEKDTIVQIAVYPPTSLENYKRNIYVLDPGEEHSLGMDGPEEQRLVYRATVP